MKSFDFRKIERCIFILNLASKNEILFIQYFFLFNVTLFLSTNRYQLFLSVTLISQMIHIYKCSLLHQQIHVSLAQMLIVRISM